MSTQRYARAKRKPLIVTFYLDPPTEEVTVKDFEQLAWERLQVLRHIEHNRFNDRSDDRAKADREAKGSEVHQKLRAAGLDDPVKDKISHFILRLAYCKDKQAQDWFREQEMQLFCYRFDKAYGEPQAIRRCLEENNLHFEQVPDQEIQDLIKRGEITSRTKNETKGYYKVPFEEALDQVRMRDAYIQDGFVYAPDHTLTTLVATRFREHISKELARSKLFLFEHAKSEERVGPVLQHISDAYSGPTFSHVPTGEISLQQLPTYADRCFPLCMHHLYTSLLTESHLKHGGRQQFSLFLKAIGLSLDDALNFWRSAFSKKTPPDQFNKKYAYNIRHNYGKEGKGVSYSAYSCAKILNMMTSAEDRNGCPFKRFDKNHLRAKLVERRVPVAGIQRILDLQEKRQYQQCCHEYWKIMHNETEPAQPIFHPNTFFKECVSYDKAIAAGQPYPPPLPSASPSSSSSSSSSFRQARTQVKLENPSSSPSSSSSSQVKQEGSPSSQDSSSQSSQPPPLSL